MNIVVYLISFFYSDNKPLKITKPGSYPNFEDNKDIIKSFEPIKSDKSDKSDKSIEPIKSDNFKKSDKSDKSIEPIKSDNFKKSDKSDKSISSYQFEEIEEIEQIEETIYHKYHASQKLSEKIVMLHPFNFEKTIETKKMNY